MKKYGLSLREQETMKKHKALLGMYEKLVKDHYELQRQYCQLQDDFEKLAGHKITMAIRKSIPQV